MDEAFHKRRILSLIYGPQLAGNDEFYKKRSSVLPSRTWSYYFPVNAKTPAAAQKYWTAEYNPDHEDAILYATGGHELYLVDSHFRFQLLSAVKSDVILEPLIASGWYDDWKKEFIIRDATFEAMPNEQFLTRRIARAVSALIQPLAQRSFACIISKIASFVRLAHYVTLPSFAKLSLGPDKTTGNERCLWITPEASPFMPTIAHDQSLPTWVIKPPCRLTLLLRVGAEPGHLHTTEGYAFTKNFNVPSPAAGHIGKIGEFFYNSASGNYELLKWRPDRALPMTFQLAVDTMQARLSSSSSSSSS